MKQYYIIIPGKPQEGPLGEESLIRRYKEGTLPHETYVWCPGMSNWQPLMMSPLAAAIKEDAEEIFFNTSHPCWTFIFVGIATICYMISAVAENEETFNIAWTFFSPFATLFTFYLACWFLTGTDKRAIKNLFFHTLMLVLAEFMLYLPYLNSDEVTLPQMIICLVNWAAYFFIPYKLYKFSMKRSLWVVGITISVQAALLFSAMAISGVF